MPTWTMPRRAAVTVAALCAVAPAAFAAEAPPEFTIADPRITESSGLQASHRHPGVYWTHNDQDTAPNLYAVDGGSGETVATVTLAGVEGRDLEAISLGADGDLYVGDIGDNLDGTWPEVWIYRLPEPERLADATVTPTVYTARYEDGPRDAEALMVHPGTGRVYIASKKEDSGGALYAGPEELSESAPNTFARVADIDVWVTDGAFSPDGTRLMLRGYFVTQMYRWRADGTPEPVRQRIVPPGPLQGESVTFTPDGRTLMFGGEGAASEVEPEPLTGELLPETVQPAEEDTRGDEDPAGGSGDGDAKEDQDGDIAISSEVAITLIVAALLVLGLRRLFARGGGAG